MLVDLEYKEIKHRQLSQGSKKAILYIYLPTGECFRRIVLGFTEEESIERAVAYAKYARSITKSESEQVGTERPFEFGPEIFSNSSPESVIRSYEAVKAASEPSAGNPIIFTLPATIEMSTPNVYAEQIEYFCTHISERHRVQKETDEHGRELLSAEITDLFEKTYFPLDHPRFNILDYSISIDRSTSPVPPGSGKTRGTRNLSCLFESIVSIDGREYQLRTRGNGPILSLTNALKDVDIDLYVADYKEHAIGGGREVKATT
ncbi:hypothetical protein F4809DRAFT_639967 [Biscogniauxia mediterranea]|nr:hypothetical protein F4809DRAFT_639967 [Biscogniauxia mediterranea]